jgi:hypothetical protein
MTLAPALRRLRRASSWCSASWCCDPPPFTVAYGCVNGRATGVEEAEAIAEDFFTENQLGPGEASSSTGPASCLLRLTYR